MLTTLINVYPSLFVVSLLLRFGVHELWNFLEVSHNRLNVLVFLEIDLEPEHGVNDLRVEEQIGGCHLISE
jgi:hypothetical protein